MKNLAFIFILFLNIHPISEIEHYNQRNPASALFCKQDSDCEAEECFFIDVKTDSKICLKEFDRRVNKSKLNSIELEELKKAQSLLSTPSGYL